MFLYQNLLFATVSKLVVSSDAGAVEAIAGAMGCRSGETLTLLAIVVSVRSHTT